MLLYMYMYNFKCIISLNLVPHANYGLQKKWHMLNGTDFVHPCKHGAFPIELVFAPYFDLQIDVHPFKAVRPSSREARDTRRSLKQFCFAAS